MKPKLYLFLLVPVLMLGACEKWVPDTNYNHIVGNWELVSVERQRGYGTEPVYTGYEEGIFYFRNNEQAEYSDHIGRMNGTWRLVQRSDGYYDHNGNWHNGGRQSLELRLYDHYSSHSIEWEFHTVEFISSNRMVGYMSRYGEEYRYEFRRY